MSAINITRVIDAAKNFVLRTRKAHINHITDIYIVSTQYDYMSDYVGLYITSCIVQYLVHDSASKPDRRRKCVYTYTTETQIIPYYDLTIYSQVSLPNYTSLSYAEMDKLFNLLEWII